MFHDKKMGEEKIRYINKVSVHIKINGIEGSVEKMQQVCKHSTLVWYSTNIEAYLECDFDMQITDISTCARNNMKPFIMQGSLCNIVYEGLYLKLPRHL